MCVCCAAIWHNKNTLVTLTSFGLLPRLLSAFWMFRVLGFRTFWALPTLAKNTRNGAAPRWTFSMQ